MKAIHKKGVYIVTEEGCLIAKSGAYQHIHIGFSQLNQYFEMKFLTPTLIDSKDNLDLENNGRINRKWQLYKASPFTGMLRDIAVLMKNFAQIIYSYKKIKNENASFIYERAAYLNFNGLIVSKLLGIPHFYEVNCLFFESRKNYYNSYFTPIARIIEQISYKKSSHVFFVGTYGNFHNLSSNNWTNIENGIEADYIRRFATKAPQNSKADNINICFIARLMKHQRPDLLVDAFKSLKNKKNVVLHLIGDKLDEIKDALFDDFTVIYHGYKNRSELLTLLNIMDVGIIAGSPEYQSTMKVFDYGAAKCLVIAPDIINLKHWYSNDEILFFKKGSAVDLAQRIDMVVKKKEMVAIYGEKLYLKVAAEFTWENIFGKVSETINTKFKS